MPRFHNVIGLWIGTLVSCCLVRSNATILEIGKPVPFHLKLPVGRPHVQALHHADATYISVHFAHFNLPHHDRVIVRSVDESTRYTYTHRGRHTHSTRSSKAFYSSYIPGDTAIVEYIPFNGTTEMADDQMAFAFVIDSYVRGIQLPRYESVCGGADNSRPAVCYQNGSEAERLPHAYTKARSIARLLIAGRFLCTGWLAGSEGHLITNEHCMKSPGPEMDMDIEFDAEGASCTNLCEQPLGCRGTTVASSAELITSSSEHDYALLKIHNASLSRYGYLQLRASGPESQEPIYLPQHPKGWGKRIASQVDQSDQSALTPALIVFVNRRTACGVDRIGYDADTQGGSSGSPILGARDNLVVGIHACGVCSNTGVDVRNVLKDLSEKHIVVRDLVYQVRGLTSFVSSASTSSSGSFDWDRTDQPLNATGSPSWSPTPVPPPPLPTTPFPSTPIPQSVDPCIPPTTSPSGTPTPMPNTIPPTPQPGFTTLSPAPTPQESTTPVTPKPSTSHSNAVTVRHHLMIIQLVCVGTLLLSSDLSEIGSLIVVFTT